MKTEQLNALASAYAVKAAVEQMQAENTALRAALANILRIAERGDVNAQPLLDPIAQQARAALKIKQQ